MQPEAKISKKVDKHGDIVNYTCDFGPRNFVGHTKCDGGGWTKTPFCPEIELRGLVFDP